MHPAQNKNAHSAAVVSTAAVQAAAPENAFLLYRTGTKRVETLSAADYVMGVVAAEMPTSYSVEALKAQAAAAFTYAARQRAYHRTHPQAAASIGGADLSDDPAHDQSYWSKEQTMQKCGDSFDADWAKLTQAVQAVQGLALTQNGKPIEAVYFSCSAGRTESSASVWGDAVSYLVEVDSPWDAQASDYKSTARVSKDTLRKKAAAKWQGLSLGADASKWLTVTARSGAGGVLTASIGGKTVSGTAVQALFGLRSTHFDVRYENNTFIFDVLGNGHSVGLSQYGAGALAKQGKTWQDIVRYYYPGVDITPFSW